jgi:hypothetical protein
VGARFNCGIIISCRDLGKKLALLMKLCGLVVSRILIITVSVTIMINQLKIAKGPGDIGAEVLY